MTEEGAKAPERVPVLVVEDPRIPRGRAVVCSDGAAFALRERNNRLEWIELPPIPGTAAASAE